MGKKLLIAVPVMAGFLLMGSGSVFAENAAEFEPVSVDQISVEGVIKKASELNEAYYLILVKSDGKKEVLSMTPETRITISGTSRTPDQFLRMIEEGKDSATAVYYRNVEGMKHVVSLDVK